MVPPLRNPLNLLTNEEEVDDGAHHCVEDDGPEVAHEDPVVEGPGRL
jgi:hypothetical protein